MVEINKILFITLSNIGDCILTLPVLDSLRAKFPEAKITVMAGVRPKEIFENNPYIDTLIAYNKHSKLKDKIRQFSQLKQKEFDMVVDLRNSLFGMFLPAKYKTSPFMIIPKHIEHMKDRHLYKLTTHNLQLTTKESQDIKRDSLFISPEDEEYIKNILKEENIKDTDNIIVIASGARSHIKRWPQDKFVDLIFCLAGEFGVKAILAGDKDDLPIARYIAEHSRYPVINLSGKTSITQLACLLKKADSVITNDSAILHLASYLNIPIVAMFGPTCELKYGPWSGVHAIVKKDIFCRPCEKAQCKFNTLKCMRLIKVEDVLEAAKNILITNYPLPITHYREDFKRILIVRTDRIGDVLLSTPVIKAARDNYPSAYIAMMVSPFAKDIVDGNPYLDEVIIYDKDGLHKSWVRSIKFALNLKKKRFDLAIILHPTNRAHLVTFFACIPRRVGFNRKLSFLLTDRIKHTKQLGEKHELEYNLDLVKYLGIESKDKDIFMPIRQESEEWVDELFKEQGFKDSDKLLAIHPGASCPSKIWPDERFAELADRLAQKYGLKVLVVAGPKDISLAQNVARQMNSRAINLAGRISLSQLASLLKRCQLFISNDSGPVHISSSIGTPVISIFGRSQKGLSPKRWGPVGKCDRSAYKVVGCVECLAHNCIRGFACLKAVTVDYVLNIADSILTGKAG
jgi:lipopolysaccharide heptosyltransferase II